LTFNVDKERKKKSISNVKGYIEKPNMHRGSQTSKTKREKAY
jgi:hypothetical protein